MSTPLRRVSGPFWHQLVDADRTLLSQRGTPQRFAAREVMLVQGDRGSDVLVLHTGLAKVLRLDSDGQQTMLGLRVCGDLVGEMAVLSGEPRTASVVALVDTTATRLSGAALRQAVGAESGVAMSLLRMLIARLDHADRHRQLSAAQSLQRVAAVLAEFHVACVPGDRSDGLPVTQFDVRDATSASLKSVQRAMRQLRDLGVVRTGQARTQIADLETLHAIAAGHVITG